MSDLPRINLWVYIFRSEDDPNIWVAHCREIDIVAFGDSPVTARDAVRDSIEDAFYDDIAAGLDPLDRPAAPKAIHNSIDELLSIGRSIEFQNDDVAEREKVNRFVVVIGVDLNECLARLTDLHVSFALDHVA